MSRKVADLLPGRVKPEADKLQRGRARKLPPADALEVIRQTAATGSTKLGVAMALGTCVDVLVRWLDEYPELKQAFDEGRERERQTLHSHLFEAAAKGNIVAAIFLLKSKHHYVEGDKGDQGNRVSINFQMPGAMPLDQFMTIENEPDRAKPIPATTTRIARGG